VLAKKAENEGDAPAEVCRGALKAEKRGKTFGPFLIWGRAGAERCYRSRKKKNEKRRVLREEE